MNTLPTPQTEVSEASPHSEIIQSILAGNRIGAKEEILDMPDEQDIATAYGFDSVDEYRQYEYQQWVEFQESNGA